MFANKALGGSPTLTYSLTHEMAAHFTRPVVDAIMGIACAPCQGAQVDLKAAAYAQHHAVVKAAVYGHASFAEASAELAERMDTATTDIEVNKIRGALDSLKLGVDSAIHTSSGVLAFCWAKISNVLFKRNDPTFKLEVGVSGHAPVASGARHHARDACISLSDTHFWVVSFCDPF
jgi:hypothetical protein